MKNYKNPIWKAVLLTAVVFVACNNDQDSAVPEDGTLYVLTSNLGETDFESVVDNVPVTSSIELVFTHTLDTDAITSALKLSSGSSDIPHQIEFSNSNSVLKLIPGALEHETSYTLSLPVGVYGAHGEALEVPFSLEFNTAAFIPPSLTLSSDVSELIEDGGTAIITASLNREAEGDVTATLVFGGTASPGVDYTINGVQDITIPQGSLSTSISITAVMDGEFEGDELVEVSMDQVVQAINDTKGISIRIVETLPPLSLKGILALEWDGSGTNDGKAIHLVANQDISDLSQFGLGTANNGGGTDGNEFTLPALAVSAGDDILVAREIAALSIYFGGCTDEFEHLVEAGSAINQNGDDAIELFQGNIVLETYGDIDVDGSGMEWEYTGSWAYKIDGAWMVGGVDCTVGSTTVDAAICPYPICSEALSIQGVLALSWDGSGTNGGKAVHLKATKDIPDLSIYGIGVANNGGGTDGIEYTLPAIAVEEGDDILLAREPATLAAYFGNCMDSFEHIIETESMNQNGDDAIELFNGTTVVETFGDANVDGTGTSWDYSGSWAYKLGDGWTTGGVDCADGSTTTQGSTCSYPACN